MCGSGGGGVAVGVCGSARVDGAEGRVGSFLVRGGAGRDLGYEGHLCLGRNESVGPSRLFSPLAGLERAFM